jgi:hypothetical protein
MPCLFIGKVPIFNVKHEKYSYLRLTGGLQGYIVIKNANEAEIPVFERSPGAG